MPLATAPIAQSPLAELHRRNGATTELRDGWMVATCYPDEPGFGRNAVIDLAHRPTFEINGPDVGRMLVDLCGADVAVRQIHSGAGWQACRLTSKRAIIFGKVPMSGPRRIGADSTPGGELYARDLARGGLCALASCGNGTVDTGEDCEDGNLVNFDGCNNNCKFTCKIPTDCRRDTTVPRSAKLW